jgi:hypothetical protein
LTVLLIVTTPISATIITSAITGRVTSANAPAAGVTVTVTSKALLGSRVVTTGAGGMYWIGALPPGEYDVTFAREGLTTLTRRAIVELARVARADAALEPSAEGDSVTSTAKTISVADTTEITTHYSDAMLDRMPTRRVPTAAESIGPASAAMPQTPSIDGVPLFRDDALGEEVIEQVTVIRGGVPAEYDDERGAVLAAITHSGGEDFSLTVRDTITNHGSLFESASGGHVVPERLWFFASGWSGSRGVRGYALKFSGQLAPSHQLVAEALDSDDGSPFGASFVALRYTATPRERLTFEALADRSNGLDVASATASLRTGAHVLTAGGTSFDGRDLTLSNNTDALYISDRWSAAHWTVKAGLRREDSDTLPRAAVTFDPRDDGTRAVVATYGEYADPGVTIRIATLGYAAAIGSSGSARVDVVHRQRYIGITNELQLDARYRLFDRFEAGADYSYIRFAGRDAADHAAAGWISAEVPLGGHELGATLLQRWSDLATPFGRRNAWPVDLALRYSVPFSRFGITLATDLTNAFDSGDAIATEPRALRFWIRARI